MSQKKMGRPKVANPKTIEVKTKIDNNQKELLDKYCNKNNIKVAEALRIGINKLIDELK